MSLLSKLTAPIVVIMTDQISLSVALTLAGMIAGGGLTYGALRQTVTDLKAILTEVKAEVVTLRAEVTKLSTEVEIMKRVDERLEDRTARHDRDPRRE